MGAQDAFLIHAVKDVPSRAAGPARRLPGPLRGERVDARPSARAAPPASTRSCARRRCDAIRPRAGRCGRTRPVGCRAAPGLRHRWTSEPRRGRPRRRSANLTSRSRPPLRPRCRAKCRAARPCNRPTRQRARGRGRHLARSVEAHLGVGRMRGRKVSARWGWKVALRGRRGNTAIMGGIGDDFTMTASGRATTPPLITPPVGAVWVFSKQ